MSIAPLHFWEPRLIASTESLSASLEWKQKKSHVASYVLGVSNTRFDLEYIFWKNSSQIVSNKRSGIFIDIVDLGVFKKGKRYDLKFEKRTNKGTCLGSVFLTYEYPSGNLPRNALESSNPSQYLSLSEVLVNLGRHLEARVLLDRILTVQPSTTRAWALRADIERARENYIDAEMLYWRAIDIDPGDVAALAGLGQVFAIQGQMEDATRLFNKLLNLEAVPLRYLLIGISNLIAIYTALAKYEDAEYLLRKLHNRHSMYSAAASLLDKISALLTSEDPIEISSDVRASDYKNLAFILSESRKTAEGFCRAKNRQRVRRLLKHIRIWENRLFVES
jgi:tetratricopeptide (TPR) repeat protein